MKEELFDTYEAMTEEEKAELFLIQRVKQNIKYFVGIDNIIEKITSLIDSSDYFNFNNERNKKYINKRRPTFIITLNNETLKRDNINLKYKASDGKDFIINNKTNPEYHNDIDWIQNKVYSEIVRPYSEYLENCISDNEKFKNILKEQGLEQVTLSDEIIKLVMMTSAVMFAIKVDLKGDRIYLEYAI